MLATRRMRLAWGSSLGDLAQAALEADAAPAAEEVGRLLAAIVGRGAATRTRLRLTGAPWRPFDWRRLGVECARLLREGARGR